MKIDPRVQSSGQSQSDSVRETRKGPAHTSSGKTDALASSSSGDTIQISSRHAEVQRLTAQASAIPEVRSDRVAPLKSAVERNSYQPDSGKIADAMLAEQSSKRAKA